ncbi:MAG: 2-oxoacid:acceptor oxidoreductase family protein [bacterium]
MKEKRILISGSGGQGVLLLGKILATAGMLDGRQVTWIPSYGAEMRGGIADCMVIIADEDIGSPLVKKPDILIAMNSQALEKYAHTVVSGGFLLAGITPVGPQSIRRDVDALFLPALEIAKAASGYTRLANMVMLGALCFRTRIVPRERVEQSIRLLMNSQEQGLVSLNLNVLQTGIEYCIRGEND